jgi:cathepsin B
MRHPSLLFALLCIVCGARAWPGPSNRLQGLRPGDTPLPERRAAPGHQSNLLPASFDAREQWGACIHPVRNQLDCGSCWAFAASEVLSDRFCIASNRTVDVVLSPQDLLSCEKLNLKCEVGSLPNWAWSFLESHGICSEECAPYVSGDGHVPSCPKSCESGQALTRFKAQNTRHVQGEAAIMQEILANGPVDVTFNVYSDFQPYCSEGENPCPVYQKKAGGWEGLHSVKMIGWGQLNATAYWLVQNSWGNDWGEAGDGPSARCILFASVEVNLSLLQPSHVTCHPLGFFRILRGSNECGIESLVYAGDADL